MSRIVELEASTWTREDLPGYHLRFTMPDNGKVIIDGMEIVPLAKGAPVTAAGAAIAGNQGGYVSEIEQMLKLYPKTDAQGRLVNGQTGEVITQPENTDPWPLDYGDGTIDEQVAILLQFQFDHPYRRNQINVDSNDLGQPGDPTLPKFMLGTGGGKLRPRADAAIPPVVPVTVLPIPSSGDFDVNVNIGAERQAKMRTDKLGSGTVRYHLTAPNIPNPTSPGQVDFAEVSGSATHNSEIVVTNAAGQELFRATAIDPSVSWSTAPGGVDVVIPPGTLSTWAFRHVDAISATEGNDVWSQWRNPA